MRRSPAPWVSSYVFFFVFCAKSLPTHRTGKVAYCLAHRVCPSRVAATVYRKITISYCIVITVKIFVKLSILLIVFSADQNNLARFQLPNRHASRWELNHREKYLILGLLISYRYRLLLFYSRFMRFPIYVSNFVSYRCTDLQSLVDSCLRTFSVTNCYVELYITFK